MAESRLTELLDKAIQSERSGRFAEARDWLRQAIAEDDGVASMESRLMLGRLSIAAGGDDDHAEAERELSTARSLAEQVGATHSRAHAIHLLAWLAAARYQVDLAQQLLAESPAADPFSPPSAARAQWLHFQGLIWTHRGELNSAERFLFQSQQVARDCNSKLILAEVYDSLAALLIRRGKANHALSFARMSLELKNELGNRHETAISHGTAGRALVLLSRYDESAQEFQEALAIARDLGATQIAARVLNSLGEVAYLRALYDEATRYHEEARSIMDDPEHLAHAYLGLARIHLAAKRLDQAAEACDQAATILGDRPAFHDMALLLKGLRGAIAWRRGDHETGEAELENAVSALRLAGYPIDTIELLYSLRDLYQERGALAKAVEVMARALDLLSECGSERGVKDIEDWLRTVDSPNLTRMALERYFPSWLIDRMLENGLRRLPSRHQKVAVLFTDIRDFTSLTEGLGPETLVELLNEWFSEASRIVRRHGGYVDKFIGDAVMALFGVPEEGESMATDAIQAALELREALETMNLRRRFLGQCEFRVGIGIDTGEAVIGFIGSAHRQSYTAIGDVVNTASRLESATKDAGCDILISSRVEEAHRRSPLAETRFVGNLSLKGMHQAVSAFMILGPLAMVPKPTAPAARPTSYRVKPDLPHPEIPPALKSQPAMAEL